MDIRFEKLLTALAMPAAVIWLILIVATVLLWRWRSRRAAILLTVVTLAYTLVGTGHVGTALSRHLEAPWRDIDPMSLERFDAIVVLGGGTATSAGGHVQLVNGGDRVITAARMYHAGKADHIVATGKASIPTDPPTPDPSAESLLLLRQLKVPESAITPIGGRNTSEELRQVAELAATRQWKRIGLVTSAWHMSRAMRLAKAAGVDVQPVPCDFRSRQGAGWSLGIIPGGGAFADIETSIKELLAGLVGR